MAAATTSGIQTQWIVEWVTGGPYAIAVKVEATFLPNRPGEPILTRETVQKLEDLARSAAAGDLEKLRLAGDVYVRVD